MTAIASSLMLFLVAGNAVAGARMVKPGETPRRIITQPAARATTTHAPAHERWVARDAILVDETTGKTRRPSVAETENLVRGLRQMFARTAPAMTPAAKGQGLRMSVDGGIPNVVVARATADGQMETRCVQTFDEAVQFLGLVPQTGSGNDR